MSKRRRALYVRPCGKLVVEPEQPLTLGDLVEAVGPPECLDSMVEEVYIRAPEHGGEVKTVSFLRLVSELDTRFPDVDVHPIGTQDILVEVEEVNRNEQPTLMRRAIVVAVAALFTLGAAMAIMNFHADVSMPEVHERIYFLLTGDRATRPLWMQIPYSLGVGAGILVFFNQIRRLGRSQDPSPLELEMYLYDRNVDQFRLAHEDEPGSPGGP